jgi:hypothetical protein
VASDDPALLSTPQMVASAHSSAARILLPALVLASAVAMLAWIGMRRRGKSAKA